MESMSDCVVNRSVARSIENLHVDGDIISGGKLGVSDRVPDVTQ